MWSFNKVVTIFVNYSEHQLHDSRFSKMPASLERTMNGDNTITGAKSAQRARNKELSKIDQIRGLELAVMEYKKDANDKNWSTIDKILQVRKSEQLKILPHTTKREVLK